MSGFIDLRLNRQDGQVNESFWPSFTDIMTVVMMIFLIAMVVLLMRNMELVKELRTTMDAERIAAANAAQTGAVNHSLSLKLEEAEARATALQQQLTELQAATAKQQADDRALLEVKQRDIATLLSERNDLAEQLAMAHLALDEQKLQLANTEQHVLDVQQQQQVLLDKLNNAESRLENTMRQRDTLDSQLTDLQKALSSAERDQQENKQQYSELVGKYDNLRVKYDKLVRPARSPQGRYLVEVRYGKRDDVPVIQFREDGTGPYHLLKREALDQRLSKLKSAHQEGLYVKVIIPEDSGLSYNEAWTFTRDMLGLYDYYYEGQQEQLRPDR